MELSLKDLKELLSSSASTEFYFKPGTKLFIRTVTMYLTGKLVSAGDKELVLEDACWIADSGRFGEFLRTGKINECEAFPDGIVLVGRGSVIDLCEWKHPLPRKDI